MSTLFLVPKNDEVKADAPRPLSSKERKLLRKSAGGNATVEQLEALAADPKFAKRFDAKASKATKKGVGNQLFTLVEVIDFDIDPDGLDAA